MSAIMREIKKIDEMIKNPNQWMIFLLLDLTIDT